MRFGARALGTILIVGGVLVLAWVLVVWRWGDPVTALYTRYEQQALRRDYVQQTRVFAQHLGRPASAAPTRLTLAAALAETKHNATAYRAQLRPGDPVGVLDAPRMGLHTIVVNGTDHDSLNQVPGATRAHTFPARGSSSISRVTARRTARPSRTSTPFVPATRFDSSFRTRPSTIGSRVTGSSLRTLLTSCAPTASSTFRCRHATHASSPLNATSPMRDSSASR